MSDREPPSAWSIINPVTIYLVLIVYLTISFLKAER